jgi:spermidine synthase
MFCLIVQFQGSALKNIYYTGRSKYQKIDVVQLGSFGRCLILGTALFVTLIESNFFS